MATGRSAMISLACFLVLCSVGAYIMQRNMKARPRQPSFKIFFSGMFFQYSEYQCRPKRNAKSTRHLVFSLPSPTDSAIAMGDPAYKIYHKVKYSYKILRHPPLTSN